MRPDRPASRFARAARLSLRAAGLTLGTALLLVGLASASFFGMVSLLDGDDAAVRLASGFALAALQAIEPR